MGQIILVTERLRLEPLADEHLPHETELDADPEVMRFLTGRARTPDEVAEHHGWRLDLGRQVEGLGIWAGFLRAEPGEFVGLWMLTPPKVVGEAELGYRVHRRYWRRGLAREGSSELIRHGFDELGLQRIYAETMAVNTASRATMGSVGLRFVRVFHEHFHDPLPGTDQGEVEYEIRREDWRAAVAD